MFLAVDDIYSTGLKECVSFVEREDPNNNHANGGRRPPPPQNVVGITLTSWKLTPWVGAPFSEETGGTRFDFSLEDANGDGSDREIFTVEWPDIRFDDDNPERGSQIDTALDSAAAQQQTTHESGAGQRARSHSLKYRQTLRRLMNEAIERSPHWRERASIDAFHHARRHTVISCRSKAPRSGTEERTTDRFPTDAVADPPMKVRKLLPSRCMLLRRRERMEPAAAAVDSIELLARPATPTRRDPRSPRVRVRLLFRSGPSAPHACNQAMGFSFSQDVSSRRGFGRGTVALPRLPHAYPLRQPLCAAIPSRAPTTERPTTERPTSAQLAQRRRRRRRSIRRR